jgi:hypothetical protein
LAPSPKTLLYVLAIKGTNTGLRPDWYTRFLYSIRLG